MSRNKYNATQVLVCRNCDVWHLPPLGWKGFCIACQGTEAIRFPSKAEAVKYAELRRDEKAGRIRDLQLQPKFPVLINGVEVFLYKADFAFFEGQKRRVLDVKGVDTPLSLLKRKCVSALYNVEIELCR